MPMAGLANSFRRAETAAAAGLTPVGDAHSHTDPVLAHGLAFAFVQAAELARALASHADPIAGLASFVDTVAPALRERFDLATALDDQRHRLWTGEPVDFTQLSGAYALFSLVAGGAASMMDPAVFRMFVRRMGLLDSTSVLDADPVMQMRIEELFAQAMRTPRPPAGPPRDEMLATVSAARHR